MTIRDLGTLEGPVLLFGGNYSNRQATEALMLRAGVLGIEPSNVVCTGDVVAYCADPQATVDLMRHWGAAVLMGNCEEALAAGSADCGCGFEPGTACSVLSDAWYRHAAANLDRDAIAWMAGLPRAITFTLGGRRLRVVHGGVTVINRFVFASQPDAIAAELASAEADGVIAGHCGMPFTTRIDDRLWHNPGAIGMPANDGTARVWFSVATSARDGIRVEHHALGYDHEAAAKAMRAARLPEGYARGLEVGLWPSEDVLPATERTTRGRALAPPAVTWTSSRKF